MSLYNNFELVGKGYYKTLFVKTIRWSFSGYYHFKVNKRSCSLALESKIREISWSSWWSSDRFCAEIQHHNVTSLSGVVTSFQSLETVAMHGYG